MENGQQTTYDAIVEVVIDLLESDGYDGVQLRTVAKQARVSLATIYKFFPTRDELIVEALSRWMSSTVYSGMVDPAPDVSLFDALMSVYRQLFEPWEQNPRMLEAYHRARTGPGGHRLDVQGVAVVSPIALSVLDRADPAYAEDVGVILSHMFYAVVGRFADGQLPITEILPTLERTLVRLTADNADLADPGRRRGPSIRRRRQRSDVR